MECFPSCKKWSIISKVHHRYTHKRYAKGNGLNSISSFKKRLEKF